MPANQNCGYHCRVQFANMVAKLLPAIALLVGCGPQQMTPHPVRGRVLVRGKPAMGADVSFFGLDAELRTAAAPFPRGTTDEDGVFELTSFELGDGAPEGEYAVTVVWRAGSADEVDPELHDEHPDHLRGRYANPNESPLRAEVLDGDNDLPDFEIE